MAIQHRVAQVRAPPVGMVSAGFGNEGAKSRGVFFSGFLADFLKVEERGVFSMIFKGPSLDTWP